MPLPLPVVVLSSDKYSDVLIDFLIHLHSQLNENYLVYYSLNTKQHVDRVEGYLASTLYNKGKHCKTCLKYRPLYSSSVDWTETLRRTVEALRNEGHEKALFTLEDFFATSIDYEKLSISFQVDSDVLYVSYRPTAISSIRLEATSSKSINPRSATFSAFVISPFNKYGICLQPAIWNLCSLLSYIDESKPISPWDFERSFSATNIKQVFRLQIPAFVYADQALERGRWFPFKALTYRKVSTKPIMSLIPYVRVCIRTGVSKAIDSVRNRLATFIISSAVS